MRTPDEILLILLFMLFSLFPLYLFFFNMVNCKSNISISHGYHIKEPPNGSPIMKSQNRRLFQRNRIVDRSKQRIFIHQFNLSQLDSQQPPTTHTMLYVEVITVDKCKL